MEIKNLLAITALSLALFGATPPPNAMPGHPTQVQKAAPEQNPQPSDDAKDEDEDGDDSQEGDETIMMDDEDGDQTGEDDSDSD